MVPESKDYSKSKRNSLSKRPSECGPQSQSWNHLSNKRNILLLNFNIKYMFKNLLSLYDINEWKKNMSTGWHRPISHLEDFQVIYNFAGEQLQKHPVIWVIKVMGIWMSHADRVDSRYDSMERSLCLCSLPLLKDNSMGSGENLQINPSGEIFTKYLIISTL